MKKILFTLLLAIPFLVFAQPSLSDKNVFEFRAVWVATVVNIDWPSKPGLSSQIQKDEFEALLDMHQKNGMNAIIMQVRPSGDALYPSTLEPWSEYLMGKQGEAPSPYYDPLSFMIEATHQRGMEFHAWINPYRAVFDVNKSSIANTHLSKVHPEWFLTYGDKKYFNPGLPEVWQHTNKVVGDLVARYDIDAVHMDDYFYPYKIVGKEFPDETTFQKNARGLSKDDWRRSNCDTIVKQLSATIHKVKPWVQFGISPFGVWRNQSTDPRGSKTKATTNYDDLYADILLWLEKDWIDYVTPQLYWEQGHALADYNELIEWWNRNSYGKNFYVGHGIYRAGSNPAWKSPNEIPNQIKKMRSLKNTHGSAYFSSASFKTNANGWNDSLQNTYYHNPALIAPIEWLVQNKMTSPKLVKQQNNSYSILDTNPASALKQFALIQKSKTGYRVAAILPKETKSLNLNTLGITLSASEPVWIVAVGKQNQLSKYQLLD
jgi:uncharacterized lipoprotein YddW (UPF0748 family)